MWFHATDPQSVKLQPENCGWYLDDYLQPTGFIGDQTPLTVQDANQIVRIRKTSRGQSDLSRYKDAYEAVKAGDSLQKAGGKNGMNYCPLLRYLRKRHTSRHYTQRADQEKSGLNATVVNSGLAKTAQKVDLAMFATIATRIEP
ncbi:hypothetical protein EVAR_59150_1 [Eumeta japonica]|uniref:Uncharacterized protein n=1 Tax=Eumeta variegata TaxID=151549 RepID=A0A4C1YT61_EUMVA|nr:hypothetical protein EVAR_59150_1 [Eumeta japonica]